MRNCKTNNMNYLPDIDEIREDIRKHPDNDAYEADADPKQEERVEVNINGDKTHISWRDLAADLYSQGDASPVFSRISWGNNCVRYLVNDYPIWVTIYSADFKYPKKRRYGIFVSYSKLFDESEESSIALQKVLHMLVKLLNEKKNMFGTMLHEDEIPSKFSDGESPIGHTRDLSEFSSDSEALAWLSQKLQAYIEEIVPLIGQACESF